MDGEHLVAGNLHQRVGEFHNEADHAEAQNVLEQIRIDSRLAPPERQNRLRAGEEAQHPDAAHRLADDRRHGRARHAHVKPIDEQRIERQIQHRADHRGHHADLGAALRVDKRVHSRSQHGERRAQQIDLQIRIRKDKRILARAEEKEQRPLEQIAEHRQRQRRAEQQGEHRALNLQRAFLVLPPSGHRENRRAARAVQAGERRHDGHDRENQPHAGQRQRVSIRQVPQKDAIHDVVEQLHDFGQAQRNRLRHDAGTDAPLRKIRRVLLVQGNSSSFCVFLIIEQKANVAQNAGAQCAPLRARRRNAQFLFSATL